MKELSFSLLAQYENPTYKIMKALSPPLHKPPPPSLPQFSHSTSFLFSPLFQRLFYLLIFHFIIRESNLCRKISDCGLIYSRASRFFILFSIFFPLFSSSFRSFSDRAKWSSLKFKRLIFSLSFHVLRLMAPALPGSGERTTGYRVFVGGLSC